jgi:hypothetical protein
MLRVTAVVSLVDSRGVRRDGEKVGRLDGSCWGEVKSSVEIGATDAQGSRGDKVGDARCSLGLLGLLGGRRTERSGDSQATNRGETGSLVYY